jgi:hypothetical protein
MGALPRAICPLCGRNVALRRGGELREHWRLPAPLASMHCPAQGKTLEEARELVRRG